MKKILLFVLTIIIVSCSAGTTMYEKLPNDISIKKSPTEVFVYEGRVVLKYYRGPAVDSMYNVFKLEVK